MFLPYVENGWVQLIGATTENPSFKVNGALLSRCQVFTLQPHSPEDLEKILNNALGEFDKPPRMPPTLIPFLAQVADGDARQALNGLELAFEVCSQPIQTTLDQVAESTESDGEEHAESNVTAKNEGDDQTSSAEDAAVTARDAALMDAVRRALRKGYSRSGDDRYDFISALHKVGSPLHDCD